MTSAAPAETRPASGLVRLAVALVSIVFAVASALLELVLSPMRAGDVVSVWKGDAIGSGGGPVIGLSVLLAVAGSLGIGWFTVGLTGRRWAFAPAWVVWTILMFAASGLRTAEGDYLLAANNYVALATILIGSLTFAIYAYRMILRRMPPVGPARS